MYVIVLAVEVDEATELDVTNTQVKIQLLSEELCPSDKVTTTILLPTVDRALVMIGGA